MHLRAYLALSHVTHTGRHGFLMNVQTGTNGVKNFHRRSFCAAGVEPRVKNSNRRAPGRLSRPWHKWRCSRVSGPTVVRAASTKDKTTSVPTARQNSTGPCTLVSSVEGRKHQWGPVVK